MARVSLFLYLVAVAGRTLGAVELGVHSRQCMQRGAETRRRGKDRSV